MTNFETKWIESVQYMGPEDLMDLIKTLQKQSRDNPEFLNSDFARTISEATCERHEHLQVSGEWEKVFNQPINQPAQMQCVPVQHGPQEVSLGWWADLAMQMQATDIIWNRLFGK